MKSVIVGIGFVVLATILFLVIPGKTIAEVQPCAVGSCPREITIADSGKTLTYRVDRRFNVILNRFIYDSDDLTCTDKGMLEKTKSLRDLYPDQMQRFEVKTVGSCLLHVGDFSVTIVAVPAPIK